MYVVISVDDDNSEDDDDVGFTWAFSYSARVHSLNFDNEMPFALVIYPISGFNISTYV